VTICAFHPFADIDYNATPDLPGGGPRSSHHGSCFPTAITLNLSTLGEPLYLGRGFCPPHSGQAPRCLRRVSGLTSASTTYGNGACAASDFSPWKLSSVLHHIDDSQLDCLQPVVFKAYRSGASVPEGVACTRRKIGAIRRFAAGSEVFNLGFSMSLFPRQPATRSPEATPVMRDLGGSLPEGRHRGQSYLEADWPQSVLAWSGTATTWIYAIIAQEHERGGAPGV
jgi:hypothetical protein